MSLIQPNGRPFIHCPKCRTDIVWPTNFSAEDKASFATMTRASGIEAIKYARLALGLDLREAKGLALHIPRRPGECVRCGKSIDGEIAQCPTCRSTNLN